MEQTHAKYKQKTTTFVAQSSTGKERDSETGFSYFGARYYDSDLMTGWLSVDPMADKYPRLSPYAYCGWNPIRLVDPDGRMVDDYTAKQDGTIDKKITNDKFDRFFIETSEGEIKQVAQLEKHKAKDGETTLVNFPNNGSGFTRYGENDIGGDHSIQPIVAAALFGAINMITNNDPSIIIQFGDMSAENGNKPGTAHTGGSKSHVNGRNVDLRYVRLDRAMKPVTVFDTQFDWDANQIVVNAFHFYGFSDIKSFTNNDGKILANTNKMSNHHHHLHLQGFKNSPNIRK